MTAMTCRALVRPRRPWLFLLALLCCFSPFTDAQSWGRGGNKDRVLLSDVQTLTLHRDKMTAARRTRAIPQLTCMGGSAGCKNFVPEVVQCYNRGSDGMDVQWECKTDMSADFRFGQIEVVCEGYDSPEDPTILKGSCGLEYSLELTNEGKTHRGQNSHSYSDSSYGSYSAKDRGKNPWYVNVIFLAGVAIFVYVLYQNCIRQNQRSPTSGDDPHSGPGTRGHGRGSGTFTDPPPPYPGTDSRSFPGDGCGAQYQAPPAARGGGPGFWTGLGAGTGLGYLFGRRNTGYGGGGGMFGGGGGMFGGGGGGYTGGYGGGSSSYSSGSTASSSGGTRSASGFGGTRRR